MPAHQNARQCFEDFARDAEGLLLPGPPVLNQIVFQPFAAGDDLLVAKLSGFTLQFSCRLHHPNAQRLPSALLRIHEVRSDRQEPVHVADIPFSTSGRTQIPVGGDLLTVGAADAARIVRCAFRAAIAKT